MPTFYYNGSHLGLTTLSVPPFRYQTLFSYFLNRTPCSFILQTQYSWCFVLICLFSLYFNAHNTLDSVFSLSTRKNYICTYSLFPHLCPQPLANHSSYSLAGTLKTPLLFHLLHKDGKAHIKVDIDAICILLLMPSMSSTIDFMYPWTNTSYLFQQQLFQNHRHLQLLK